MRPHQRAPVGDAEAIVAEAENTQPEPEPEEALDERFAGDIAPPMEEDDAERADEDVLLPTDDTLPEVPAPEEYPTLEEYKAKWEERLAAHSKPQATKVFSLSALVPRPIPALWQDCGILRSPAACDCRLILLPPPAAGT